MAPLIRHSWSVLVLLTSAALITCSDLERNNPLDPKNPDGQAPRRVLVEAFVNDIGGQAMSASLAGLALLQQSYDRDRFALLEHHVQRTAGVDSLALAASLHRYETLVPQPSSQAIPDVFFDGAAHRAQGASDAEAAYLRYSEALTSSLQVAAEMSIQASAVLSKDSLSLRISISLARLGREDAGNVALDIALTSEVYPDRPVVRLLLPLDAPGQIKAGTVRSFEHTLDWPKGIDWIRPQCVIIVSDSQSREIYQCALADWTME